MLYNREKEKEVFESLLTEDGIDCKILNVWGEAGLGKTSLLIEGYLRITTKNKYPSSGLIDLYETDFSRVSTLMQVVAQRIDPHRKYFVEYYQRRKEFEDARENKQNNALSYLERKERDVFLDCYNKLTSDLALTDKKIVLFFDTFERITDGSRIYSWLFSEFLPKIDNTVVVLSGRDGKKIKFPLNLKNKVQALPLKPLPDEDTEEIFKDRIEGRIELEYLQEFTRLSGGKPLSIILMTNWVNKTRVTLADLKSWSPEQLDPKLAEEIWHEVDDYEGMAIFALAHIRHRFNQEILEHVATEFDSSTAKALMESLSHRLDIKVRDYSGYYQPHDKVRELVHQYLFPKWDAQETVRKDLSQRMLEYYDQKLSKDLDTPEKQTLIAERLYHELVVNFRLGLERLQEKFDQSWFSYQHGFWAILLTVANEFREYMELVAKPQKDIDELTTIIQVYQGWLLTLSWQFSEADHIIQELMANQSLSGNIKALTLRLASRNLRYQGKFEEAIKSGEKCLEVYQALLENHPEDRMLQAEIARVTNEIGYTYKELGQLSEAEAWFKDALLKSKELNKAKLIGYILNNLGNAYRLLGGNIQHSLAYTLSI